MLNACYLVAVKVTSTVYLQPSATNNQTVSDLEAQLLPSLEKLYELKDDKQLLVDLWCHLGKIFVDNVDEGTVFTAFNFQILMHGR